jgi:hypothetical protein
MNKQDYAKEFANTLCLCIEPMKDPRVLDGDTNLKYLRGVLISYRDMIDDVLEYGEVKEETYDLMLKDSLNWLLESTEKYKKGNIEIDY